MPIKATFIISLLLASLLPALSLPSVNASSAEKIATEDISAKERSYTAPTVEEVKQRQQAFNQTQLTAGFSQLEIDQFLARGSYNQSVIDAITKPWEAKPWHQYYPIFLTEKRLATGLKFWQIHQDTIERAAKEFNVNPEIIVAIIGIETFYGSYMGTYSVMDALYTLGFYYPPRADFFRKELANLQQLAQEEQLELDTLSGSYAGAMGYGQFIPSSYRHYAVDFDGDGRRDLLNSPIDAIGSVANYFHQHGWQADEAVAIKLKYQQRPTAKVWSGEKLHYRVAELLTESVSLAQPMDIDINQQAMLIELVQPHDDEYWVGLNNFYVITRYNRSPLYAMAVYQFSQQLKQLYLKQ